MGQGVLRKKPVFFIASDKSDRLRLEYSILVKQYSVSKSEFDFWDNLNKINDKRSGDIFEYQPYPVSQVIFIILTILRNGFWVIFRFLQLRKKECFCHSVI